MGYWQKGIIVDGRSFRSWWKRCVNACPCRLSIMIGMTPRKKQIDIVRTIPFEKWSAIPSGVGWWSHVGSGWSQDLIFVYNHNHAILFFSCWFTSRAGDVPIYCFTCSWLRCPSTYRLPRWGHMEVISRLIYWFLTLRSHCLLPVICHYNEVLRAPGHSTWPINQLLPCILKMIYN